MGEKIDDFISRMTLEEKASLLTGEGFWFTKALPDKGFSRMMLTDGPHGLRKQVGDADHLGLNDSVPATAFPTASTTACSFDVDLMGQMGRAIGEECRKEDVAVVLGPGCNIKRSPLCGRNFEYFSEDPLLSGKMAAAFINGVQTQGVGTSLKHFCANNQEFARMVTDSVIDERALNEVYLRPFEIAVKEAQPWTVMGAYNRLNGVHCTENPKLLQDKLRGEWGFDGVLVTDWGALSSYAESLVSGLDLVMPGPENDYPKYVIKAIEEGRIPEEALDEAVRHLMGLAERYKAGCKTEFTCDMSQHLQLARKIARESEVLLENDGTLPISRDAKVAVIGEFAKQPRYQGAGSSKINPAELDNLWDAIADLGVQAEYAPGYELATGDATEDMLLQAAEVASECDVAIVMVGLPDSYESEGFDRASMHMPAGHVKLVERVCAANSRTVVVLSGGSPMSLSWDCEPASVLMCYLAGCQSGGATADLLFGLANPSGKLAETWPENLDDTVMGRAFPETSLVVQYRESIYVGYRYYDAVGIEPAYPFGFGRSYTTFEYSNLRVTPQSGGYEVTLDITNTGAVKGAESVQLYVHACDPAMFMPEQVLAAFAKIELEPGQTKSVSMSLDAMAFAYWDSGWRVDAGSYEIRAAASSRDIRLSKTIELKTDDDTDLGIAGINERKFVPEDEKELLAPYYNVVPGGFTNDAFATLYGLDGRELPKVPPIKPYTVDSLMTDMQYCGIGRKVWRVMRRRIMQTASSSDEQIEIMTMAMMEHMPLRMMTMGGASRMQVDALIDFMNGDTMRGFSGLFRSLGPSR